MHRDALRATLPPKMREAAFRRYRQEQKDSPRRIDAAVCMVMAMHRAAELADSTPAIYA